MIEQSDILNRDRLFPAAVALICWGAAAVGVIAQYGFDEDPCILCTYQRIAYGMAGAVALISLVTRNTPIVFGLCGAVLVVGAAIAFYHVGVEQHWWASVTSCGGAPTTDMSLSDVLSQLNVKQPKACDEVDWTLFGISMATYNVGVFSALAGAVLVETRRRIVS